MIIENNPATQQQHEDWQLSENLVILDSNNFKNDRQ